MEQEHTLESLLHSLHDPDPMVRHSAIYELGPLKNARAMAALKDVVMEDTDIFCRKAALYWLRMTANQSDISNEAFRHALNDPSLCLEAAWNICRSGEPNPEMVEPLIRALKNSSDIARAMVMSALATMQDERAFEPIVEYLTSPSGYYRGVAAQCLGTLGDRRAIEHLEKVVDDSAVAWKEDHGPDRSVGEIAHDALQHLKPGSAR